MLLILIEVDAGKRRSLWVHEAPRERGVMVGQLAARPEEMLEEKVKATNLKSRVAH